MKKILITGVNSYIGTSFEKWLRKYSDKYTVDIISTHGDTWKNTPFTLYDVVLDVAGIAHLKIKADMEELFYKVNRDLTIDLCKKAKNEGVKQFIFLSSMNVYGDTNEIITDTTKPSPKNCYGKSKLQADEAIQEMNDNLFHVVSIRPPVVYGENCKGNFALLLKYAKIMAIFPDYENKRSIIYIDNLCEFIRLIIDKQDKGIFHPQNIEHVSTSYIVKTIANNKVVTTKIFNPIINFLIHKSRFVNKIFANDLYAMELSKYEDFSYCLFDFEKSIKIIQNRSF